VWITADSVERQRGHRGRAAAANVGVDASNEKVRWVVKGFRGEQRDAGKIMEQETRVAL
jgi:hypothetical protein